MFSEIWEQGFLKLVGAIVNTIKRIQEKGVQSVLFSVHSVHSVNSVKCSQCSRCS